MVLLSDNSSSEDEMAPMEVSTRERKQQVLSETLNQRETAKALKHKLSEKRKIFARRIQSSSKLQMLSMDVLEDVKRVVEEPMVVDTTPKNVKVVFPETIEKGGVLLVRFDGGAVTRKRNQAAEDALKDSIFGSSVKRTTERRMRRRRRK